MPTFINLDVEIREKVRSLLEVTSDIAQFKNGSFHLFSLDVLRHIHDSNIDKTLLKCLQTLLASKRSVILQSSPKLLVHYIRSIKKHRGALFSQGSQLGPSLDEVHESAMNFFISLASLISDDDADKEVWRSRVELLEVVKSENIFNRKQGGSVTVFNDILGSSIKALHDAWKGIYSLVEGYDVTE